MTRLSLLKRLLLSVSGCFLFVSLLANAEQTIHAQQYEKKLLQSMHLIMQGDLDMALQLANQHLTLYPKSRAGYVVRADILRAMTANGLSKLGEGLPEGEVLSQGLSKQLQVRWQHYLVNTQNVHQGIPGNLLFIDSYPFVMVADMQQGRLYLYKNVDGLPVLWRDYYLTIGSHGYGKQVEGDHKTPVGIYKVTRHIPAKKLPDLYGEGAFPINYPNRIDRYHKRTGYGIWLHGTPSITYARSPWASEGCFVLSDEDFQDIAQYIDVKNPPLVVLADKVEWLNQTQFALQRQQYMALLKQWERDWESLDIEAYLSHYSQSNFNLGKGDYAAWAQEKRKNLATKSNIELDIEILSLIIYPGEKAMFVVDFVQDYRSNNYQGSSYKQQYWQQNANGQWKIIYQSD